MDYQPQFIQLKTSTYLLDIVTGFLPNTKNISETITANGDKIESMDAQFTSLAELKVQEEVKLVMPRNGNGQEPEQEYREWY